MTRLSRVGAVASGLAVIAMSLFVGHEAVIEPLRAERDASRWIETTCVVERAEIVEAVDGSGTTTRHPRVRYRYEVDGRRYVGERFNLYDSPDNTSLERFSSIYRPARAVPCFYDPRSPDRSVLHRDVRGRGRALVGAMCVAFVLLGLAMVAVGLRRR